MGFRNSTKAGAIVKVLYCCVVTAYFYCLSYNVFFVYMDSIFAALGLLLFVAVWMTSQRGNRDMVWASVLFLVFLAPLAMFAYAITAWTINGFAP